MLHLQHSLPVELVHKSVVRVCTTQSSKSDKICNSAKLNISTDGCRRWTLWFLLPRRKLSHVRKQVDYGSVYLRNRSESAQFQSNSAAASDEKQKQDNHSLPIKQVAEHQTAQQFTHNLCIFNLLLPPPPVDICLSRLNPRSLFALEAEQVLRKRCG